jgi:RNA polymerase sigma factor (sigma-70 family)
MASEFGESGCGSRQAFRTTQWSLILSARTADSEGSQAALEQLCQAYWYPVYSFARRRGHDHAQAEDLTQAFFARFLEKNDLAGADTRKGRFRTFLLACVQNFLVNEWDRANAQKRGGGIRILSLDDETAKERFELESRSGASPELAYEQRWVEALLETVLRRLHAEFEAAGKGDQFDALKVYLTEERGAVVFAEMAQRLGVTEGAVKGVVRRMRQRYREIFREEVANTIGDPREVEDEIRHLIKVMSGSG